MPTATHSQLEGVVALRDHFGSIHRRRALPRPSGLPLDEEPGYHPRLSLAWLGE